MQLIPIGVIHMLDIKAYVSAIDCTPDATNGHIPNSLDEISKG
jgi:tRNA (Thr-GGU) A37 N-methylase